MAEGVPDFYVKIKERYPAVWESYAALGAAVGAVKGIDKKTQHLVKLGIAIGSGREGAVHSHARRAREAGFSDEEIYHTALMAVTAIGWPGAAAALSWIDDILQDISHSPG